MRSTAWGLLFSKALIDMTVVVNCLFDSLHCAELRNHSMRSNGQALCVLMSHTS